VVAGSAVDIEVDLANVFGVGHEKVSVALRIVVLVVVVVLLYNLSGLRGSGGVVERWLEEMVGVSEDKKVPGYSAYTIGYAFVYMTRYQREVYKERRNRNTRRKLR
jgi:hypothetical protein